MLEASAGTGKTFTIAALATRYVAEGVAELPELMLVTFSRAATQELRERVRERLVTAERAAWPTRRRALLDGDELLALLADAPDAEVVRRRHRLTRALAAFDAATIATTHGFCLQMLAGLGMAGDLEPDATFVEDVDDLVVEVVDDLYVRRFAGESGEPAVDPRTALTVARSAIGDPQARLVQTDAPDGSSAQPVTSWRPTPRKRWIGASGCAACSTTTTWSVCCATRSATRCAARPPSSGSDRGTKSSWSTSSRTPTRVQWRDPASRVPRRTTLVLIGDPKQAIYAFRGADVVAYLDGGPDARRRTHARPQLAQRRAVADALDALFRGAALGDERIGSARRRRRTTAPRLDGRRAAVAAARRRRPLAAVSDSREDPGEGRRAGSSPKTSPPTSSGCSTDPAG